MHGGYQMTSGGPLAHVGSCEPDGGRAANAADCDLDWQNDYGQTLYSPPPRAASRPAPVPSGLLPFLISFAPLCVLTSRISCLFNIAENDGVYIDPSKTPKTADDIDHEHDVERETRPLTVTKLDC